MTLSERVRRIKKGDNADRVEKILGHPTIESYTPRSERWTYYLDETSGYEVVFDYLGKVEEVRSWLT